MNQDITFQELILIGGGHSHIHILKMNGLKLIKGVRITLISKDTLTPYSGMLPGYVSGIYNKNECHLDLRQLCSYSMIRFIQNEVCHLDIYKKLIYFKDNNRPPLHYHIVSIDIGIVPKIDCIDWSLLSLRNITPVKPIDRFAERWTNIVEKVALKAHINSSNHPLLRLSVVGGGAGGCELALAIHTRLTSEFQKYNLPESVVEISLVHKGSDIMPQHNRSVRKIMTRLLKERGIILHLNANVVSIEESPTANSLQGNQNVLICEDGKHIYYDEVVWCTQAAPQEWLKNTGLELTPDGFILVKQTLQSVNNPDVFACGDVCEIVGHPRPKAGVFAVRAGPPLLNNLRKRLSGIEELDDWTPQEQFLGIIGTGREYAVASRGPLALEGQYLWTLKDHIDRTWMDGYRNLKRGNMSMKSSTEEQSIQSIAENLGPEAINLLLHSKMRCGGCGSKVGSQILERVLKKIKKYVQRREGVVGGLGVTSGDDAALIRIPNNPSDSTPLLSVHSIDYFRSFISDPFILGKIAAVHALSDLHAMCAEPVSALALCVIPYGPEKQVESDLSQLLAGICSILKEENCALVGGHTSEGSDLAVGLSVNGYVREGCQTPKGPPKDGDILILTKPLGTGVILAADMRAEAKGEWVEEAISSMIQSNKNAAKLLQKNNNIFECSGSTDVTGFGLMGHLLEMMKYSSTNSENDDVDDDIDSDICIRKAPIKQDHLEVTINLSQVPFLNGAIQCVELGILSTLHPQNLRCARAVVNPDDVRHNNLYPLLFDPQTSGGLLISLPESQGELILQQLKSIGYPHASIIGSFKLISNSFDSGPSIRICD